jgi:tRNA threonylcarbamoyladenosine biosynthesis protein TsaE
MKTYSENQISDIASELIKKATSIVSSNHATLITLSGDLGAGKTTLTKEIARELGITENMQSPTYVIYKKYQIPHPNPLLEGEGAEHGFPWEFLIHGDMYRLESGSDLEKLGWQELLQDPKNLIIIEWPELVSDSIPDWAIRVSLTHQGELLRGIDFLS